MTGYMVEVQIRRKWHFVSLHSTKGLAIFSAASMAGASMARVRHVKVEDGPKGVVWDGSKERAK